MITTDLQSALAQGFTNGISYADYSTLSKTFAKEGKSSGAQKPSYIEYSKLSAARLKRWEKVYKPSQETLDRLAAGVRPGEKWLVFSETWCGDAAHNVPFIAKWADHIGVELKVIFRDENVELMDEFLTNGGRSIPKLVRMTADYEVLGTWGPRPTPLMEEYANWRAKDDFDYKEWTMFAQDWYNTNKGAALEADFMELLG